MQSTPRQVETQLSEREQHLAKELELKDVKMEKFRACLKDYVVRFILWLVFSSSPELNAFSLEC